MATIERTYTVPLRVGFRNAPKYYRTNRAVKTLIGFLTRHMKVEEDQVRIGQHLNEELWRNGIKNPPARVTITVKKTDAGLVTAELAGKDYKDVVKPQARQEQPQGLQEKLKAAIGSKDKEAPSEDEQSEEPVAEEKPVKAPKAAKKPAE